MPEIDLKPNVVKFVETVMVEDDGGWENVQAALAQLEKLTVPGDGLFLTERVLILYGYQEDEDSRLLVSLIRFLEQPAELPSLEESRMTVQGD